MSKRNKSIAEPSTMADWKARSDAEHLLESHRIRKDPKRMAAARKHLQQMHDDASERQDNIREELAEGEKHTERK